MKQILSLSQLKPHRKYLQMSLLMSFTFMVSMVFSQNDKGKISSWHLAATPGGISSTNKTYTISWDVKNINSQEGHIRAKLWTEGKPECFSYADFKWTFSRDVSNIFQGEIIKTTLSVETKSGAACHPPNDPTISFHIMSGVMWDKKIGGEISEAGKDLIAYATKDDQYNNKATGNAVNDINFIVRDQTGIGAERDAQDGGFFLQFFWRGNRYEMFYKYAPGAMGNSGISGNWNGKWYNNTFGTNGNCKFTFSDNGYGEITAVGNEGFGRMSGKKTGNAIALHTSAENNYEYWSVITFDDPDNITLRYIGYGHKGSRQGKNWTGYINLRRE